MSLYLDASAFAGLIEGDALKGRADMALRSTAETLLCSDLAAAEFASIIGRRFRMGELTVDQANESFIAFDKWRLSTTSRVTLRSDDVVAAIDLLRRLDLHLRTPDALHIALVLRLGARLLTFDKKMTSAARLLGIDVASA